jgi:hypothetical protein
MVDRPPTPVSLTIHRVEPTSPNCAKGRNSRKAGSESQAQISRYYLKAILFDAKSTLSASGGCLVHELA